MFQIKLQEHPAPFLDAEYLEPLKVFQKNAIID